MSPLKLGGLLPAIPMPNLPHKFDKLMRTLPSSSPPSAAAAASAAVAAVPFLLPSRNQHHHQCVLFTERWRKGVTMCARLQVAAHVKEICYVTSKSENKNNKNRNHFLVASPFSSESGREKRAAAAAASPPRFLSPPSNESSSSFSSFPPPCSSSETGGAAGLVSDSMASENGASYGSGRERERETNGPHSLSSSSQGPQRQQPKLLTLPTILTLGRVAAIPIFIGTYYADSWWGTAATTSIFIAAAVTDWLDGYIARKMCLGTAFGAFLDPVADKLMVAATLVLLCSRPSEAALFKDLPWLLPVPAILIIGREITMSAVREWAASQNSKLSEAVAVNNLGKWKTATQMIALTILLASRDSSDGFLASSGVVFLYVSAGLAVWSLVVYGKKIWKVLLR